MVKRYFSQKIKVKWSKTQCDIITWHKICSQQKIGNSPSKYSMKNILFRFSIHSFIILVSIFLYDLLQQLSTLAKYNFISLNDLPSISHKSCVTLLELVTLTIYFHIQHYFWQIKFWIKKNYFLIPDETVLLSIAKCCKYSKTNFKHCQPQENLSSYIFLLSLFNYKNVQRIEKMQSDRESNVELRSFLK